MLWLFAQVVEPPLLANPSVNTGLFGVFLTFLASLVVWQMRANREDVQKRITADLALVTILTELHAKLSNLEKAIDHLGGNSHRPP